MFWYKVLNNVKHLREKKSLKTAVSPIQCAKILGFKKEK